MGKKIFLVLIMLVGIALGPVYWFYEKLYSGEVALSLEMTPVGDGSWTTAPFKLDPSMQPAGLIFHSQASFVPRQDENKPPSDPYTATLYKDGAASNSIPFPLAAAAVANSNPVFNERLFWLNKVQGGEYRLEIKPMIDPVIALEHPRVDVRAGVKEPDNYIATAGFLMMIFGFLLLFL